MLTKFQIQGALKKCAGDGHTIFKEDAFNILPEEFINPLKEEYLSDSNVIPKLYGIYSLKLLWAIAHDIKADTTIACTKMGRGFMAQALTDAINNKLEEM